MAGEYRELTAGAALEPFVECFWTGGASPIARSVLPDTCVDFVFSRSTGLRLVGTMTRPLLVPASRDEFVGVRFRPGMAGCFLDLSVLAVADRVLPLEDVWGSRGRRVEEQLRNAGPPEEMLRILRASLQRPTQVSPIQSALEFLARNGGMVSLTEISRYAGVSPRQLRRRCLQETGITPKQLARIARFRRACSTINRHPRAEWAHLALECGYYDQAHLIHDFQEFSGQTPGNYLERIA